MNRMKKTCYILLIVVLLTSVLAACSPAQRPGPTDNNQNQQMQTPQMEQSNQDATKAKEIATKIDQDIAEINSATVVISGNQAWVGVDAYADKEVTAQVKDRISNMLKQLEPNIQTVYVTADADLVTRIRNIAYDIAAGKPVSGFMNELTEIARRINPTPR